MKKIKLRKTEKKLDSIKLKTNVYNKGITLIALVVTIIILLILAGVTLNMAMNGDGLFSRARNAADKYKKAQEDEQDLISEIGKEMNSEYIGAFVTGYNPKPKSDGCTIGTTTSGTDAPQIINTETMKWRIWDYDGTTLRLISETPTTATLQLKDKAGYNNGVYAINEVCRELYNSDETGVTVSNLKRSDIEAVSNYDYTKYKHEPAKAEEVIGESSESNLIYYGETKTYVTANQSPSMWEKHDKDWTYNYEKSTQKATGDKDTAEPWEREYGSDADIGAGNTTAETKFTQSFYYHNYLNKEGEFKNSKYYDLLFKNGEGEYFNMRYWLAGRFVALYDGYCTFGLSSVIAKDSDCNVGGNYAFFSRRYL